MLIHISKGLQGSLIPPELYNIENSHIAIPVLCKASVKKSSLSLLNFSEINVIAMNEAERVCLKQKLHPLNLQHLARLLNEMKLWAAL